MHQAMELSYFAGTIYVWEK